MKFTLSRNHGISSLLIRARLRDRWSHGFVNVGETRIIDSTFKYGGVRKRDLRDVLSDATNISVIDAPLDREAEASDWLEAQLGKSYDTRSIFGWAGAGRDWHDEYAWFCFELIAAQIEAGSSYRFANRNRVKGSDLIAAAQVLRGER